LSASGSDMDATSQSLLNPGFRRKHGGKTWGSVTGDFTTERRPGQFRLSGPGYQRHVKSAALRTLLAASLRRAATPSSQLSLDFLNQKLGLTDGVAGSRNGPRRAATIPVAQTSRCEDGCGHHNSLCFCLLLQIFHGNSPGVGREVSQRSGSWILARCAFGICRGFFGDRLLQ